MSITKPTLIIIFGITGDLASRKLLPAIYHAFKHERLHPDSVILGISRREVSATELLSEVELCVNETDKVCDPGALASVQNALRMHQMSLVDGPDYDDLLKVVNDIEAEKGVCMDRLYTLAIPPMMFDPIVRNLGEHGHNKSCQHGRAATRLLIEKPFGYDLASAEALIETTGQWFSEEQLFRIDHYVAKPAVQDIVAFRSLDPLLSSIWNSGNIESIDIIAYEQLSIEGRTAFYEGVGALRDFLQNHLLQMLALLTMELPSGSGSQAFHDAKQKLLSEVLPIPPAEVPLRAVRGQYQGYRDEVGNPHSITETYAALTLFIDNPTWQAVPMRLRTGKAMASKQTEIQIHLKNASQLIFHIQPETPLELRPVQDVGGTFEPVSSSVMPIDLAGLTERFNGTRNQDSATPEAYERVLIDAALGDHTVFTSNQEVLAAWRIVEPVIQAWTNNDTGLVMYPKGSETVG